MHTYTHFSACKTGVYFEMGKGVLFRGVDPYGGVPLYTHCMYGSVLSLLCVIALCVTPGRCMPWARYRRSWSDTKNSWQRLRPPLPGKTN